MSFYVLSLNLFLLPQGIKINPQQLETNSSAQNVHFPDQKNKNTETVNVEVLPLNLFNLSILC